MEKHNRLTTSAVWVPGLAGLAWLLSGLLNGWMIGHARLLPTQFVDLVFPKTLTSGTWQLIQPWAALLPVLSLLAMTAATTLIFAVVNKRAPQQSVRQRPGFLAAWMCIVCAAFGTGALAAIGGMVAAWPPARLAWLLDGVEPVLFPAVYWAIVWGWVPAFIGTRFGARRSTMPRTPKRLPNAALVLAVMILAAAFIASVPLAHDATAAARAQQTQSDPIPLDTPEPVIYGSEEVSHAKQTAGENWCEGQNMALMPGEPDGAAGHRGLGFTLTNTGSTSCVLQSYPDVAFDDANGSAIGVLVVHGGSFMTDDPGISAITVSPGASAQAFLGWNAMAAAGDTRTGTLLVAPYAGTLRQSSPVDLDIIDGGAVALTAWELIE